MTVCVPLVKLRKNVPHVEAAIALWPSTASVAPARGISTSSMQSASAAMA